MPDRIGAMCVFLEKSVPEVRGDRVHFTATSGEAEFQVCMSIDGALAMAYATIRAGKEAVQGRVVPFRRAGH